MDENTKLRESAGKTAQNGESSTRVALREFKDAATSRYVLGSLLVAAGIVVIRSRKR
jgi:hydroxylamine dehydrogenase